MREGTSLLRQAKVVVSVAALLAAPRIDKFCRSNIFFFFWFLSDLKSNFGETEGEEKTKV